MHRRSSLAALSALASLPFWGRSALASAPALAQLKPSPRMPVLFVGHGSPMNALGDNPWRRTWQAMGQELLARQHHPQLILCVSAHWLTQGGWFLTGMQDPRTIHDFQGFPDELFAQQYPAPGAPAVAKTLAAELKSPATSAALGVDAQEWGLDHGTWSVLKPMFPKADIPVLQLSMDYRQPPAAHYALGQQLRALRERGVLIVGSGNAVHNLRRTRRDAGEGAAYDWATAFDSKVMEWIQSGNLAAMQHFQYLGEMAKQAHPTHEHYLPLLYAAGAVDAKDQPRFFNTGFQSGSISMRSVLWG